MRRGTLFSIFEFCIALPDNPAILVIGVPYLTAIDIPTAATDDFAGEDA